MRAVVVVVRAVVFVVVVPRVFALRARVDVLAVVVCTGARPSPASISDTGNATVSRAIRCAPSPSPVAKTRPSARMSAKRTEPG